MRKIALPVLLALLFSSSAFAITKTQSIPVVEKNSPSYPVFNSTVASKDKAGSTYLSFRSQVNERSKSFNKPVYSKFYMAWSYGRGVGTIPNSCPQGKTENFWGCYQGKTWSPKTCATGMEKQAGLCYKKCATNFKGVGPMCHGNLGDLDVSEVSDDVKEQHKKALANANQPGIQLLKNKQPRLKTDIKFNPVVCANKTMINLVGNKLLPEMLDKSWGKIADKIAGKQKIKGPNGKTLWVVPGLSKFVLLDLSVGAKCSEKNYISVASINVDSSVTVKVSTKMFDSVFHNLGGVSIGAAKVSIYELIPFRIYGSVSSKIGTKLAYTSTVHKNMQPVMFNNKPYAHNSTLDVTPQFKLWLASQAYLRLPSLTDFIPDLMQVGAKFHLAVVDWKVPYRLDEGVTNPGINNEWQLKESLYSDVKSGYGNVKPFLKVLGIDINVFKKEHSASWKGYEKRQPLLIREGTYPL